MAFFLGKDVTVACSAENQSYGLQATTAGGLTFNDATTGFADPLDTSTPVGATGSWGQLTSVELSIGAMDEDISYFGMRSQTKAEIKKETVLTITKKKTDNVFDGVYNNGGRYGVSGSSVGNAFADGLGQPSQQKVSSDISYGYRIHVQMKDQTETFSIPNACIQSHTTSLNADGTTEETIEFMSYVTPLVTTGNVATAATTAANI